MIRETKAVEIQNSCAFQAAFDLLEKSNILKDFVTVNEEIT